MIVIDAHQHVWDPTKVRYDWLTDDLTPINRTIEFDELRPALRRAGVDASVLVQSADNRDDTAAMLAVAAANPEVVGVVAYVPLESPADAAEQLAELRQDPLVVGVRNLIHENPDPDWLLRRDVDESLGVLEAAGATFDLVSVLPRHLEHAATIAKRHPRLRIVIDHLSKPPIGLVDREPWWSLIERAARHPLVYAKVSGLYSATASPGDWSVDTVRPFFRRAYDVFGSGRLMYGGDWPISMLAGGYDRVWHGLSELFHELGASDRERVLGGTARDFYCLDSARLERAQAHSQEFRK